MRIEHTALWVKDLEQSKEFFVKYFEGKANKKYHNIKTGFTSYFISFDGGERLEIMNSPALEALNKEIAFTGFAHLAFSVGSKEMVDELTNLLVSDGYKVVSGPRTTGDGYYESCVLDNEGNRIEITV